MTSLLSRVTTAIQDNMVERVARAIVRANRVAGCFLATPGYSLDDEVENAWEDWLPEARAAIEAMRAEELCGACPELRAMISAALSPLQPQRGE